MSKTQTSFVEGLQIELRPAPVLKRVLAACVDVGILTAVAYIAAIPIAIIFVGSMVVEKLLLKATEGSFPIMSILVFLLFLLAYMTAFHLYFILFESKTGSTPGKKLFGLKVISLDGQRLTRGQAVYRDLVRWYIDALLFIPAAISMSLTEKRQRVGDLLAGTMVVYSKAKEEQANFLYLYVRQEDYDLLMAHLQPRPVDEPMREAYLRFAYPFFIHRQAGLSQTADRERWLVDIRAILQKTEVLGLNDETVLRFFAEYCNQMEIEDLRKK